MKTRLHLVVSHLVLLLAFASLAGVSLAEGSSVPGKVNINTAEIEQLSYLPRVGPALAQRIADFREENGEFESTEDLILVRGIGEKTYAQLEPFVVVEGKTTLTRKLRSSDVEAALGSGDGAAAATSESKSGDTGSAR